MRNSMLLVLGAAAALSTVGVSQAQIVLGNGQTTGLTNVLNSTSRQFIVEDKLFTIVSYTSNAFPASAVTLQGVVFGDPLNGIGFDLTGGFGDTPNDNIISEFNIRYTVEILPQFFNQGFRIRDALLQFNGDASGSGSFARVDETLNNFETGQNIANLSVFQIVGPPTQTRLQDTIDFRPSLYRKIEVNKDVKFFSAGTGGTSSTSQVRQTFSQVPSPGAAALLGLGGLVAFRRRR